MFLNEVMVKKPEEEKSDVFHLSHIDGVYNLRCHSQYDRYEIRFNAPDLDIFLNSKRMKSRSLK